MLIQFDPATDGAGLADDDAGAVVDEERRTDRRSGMDVDAGPAVGQLRHHPGDDGHLQDVQAVGDAIDDDRPEGGIAQNDFIRADRRGVSFVGGLDVRLQHFPDLVHAFHGLFYAVHRLLPGEHIQQRFRQRLGGQVHLNAGLPLQPRPAEGRRFSSEEARKKKKKKTVDSLPDPLRKTDVIGFHIVFLYRR